MSRREIRDSAFKLVFEQLLRDDDIQELYEIADEIDEITVNDEVKALVGGTLEHAEELDGIIINLFSDIFLITRQHIEMILEEIDDEGYADAG